MRFNHKVDTIFLDPNSVDNYKPIDGYKINIILSPSLYWVKKVSLPVKSQRDAKKLLPSLFEDILPEGSYSYSVYKDGDYFFIFAYEDKKILDLISKMSISISNVLGIYFAQSVLQNIQGAMKVNDTQSIYVQDDIVLLVPCCWIEESGKLNLSDIKLSKHKISLQQYGHIVNDSYLYKFIAVMIAINLIVFAQYILTRTKVKHIEMSKDELFAKYHLKPTSFQNISMLKKYEKIDKKQTKLRKYIASVLSLKFSSGEKLTKVLLDKTTLKFEFSNATIKTHSFIKKELTAKKINFDIKLKNKIIYLEMVL